MHLKASLATAALAASGAHALNTYRHKHSVQRDLAERHARDHFNRGLDARDIVYSGTSTTVTTETTTVTVYIDDPTDAASSEADVYATTTVEVAPAATSTSTTDAAVASSAADSSAQNAGNQDVGAESVAAVSTSVAAAATTEAAATTAAAAATTVSSSAAAASTAASSGSSAGKRGIAYNNAAFAGDFAAYNSISWGYDWESTYKNWGQVSGIEYVPMCWGERHFANWATNAQAMIDAGSTHLMSFNEPDNSGQANFGYADAAKYHIQYMNPFAGKAKIGCPAITSTDSASAGISYLKNFQSACNGGCSCDFQAAHWYGEPDADAFISHLEALMAATTLPLWITEWGTYNGLNYDETKLTTFVQKAISYMESSSRIERYSYFWDDSILGDASSRTINFLGKAYLAA